jgi:hypothetical protein
VRTAARRADLTPAAVARGGGAGGAICVWAWVGWGGGASAGAGRGMRVRKLAASSLPSRRLMSLGRR